MKRFFNSVLIKGNRWFFGGYSDAGTNGVKPSEAKQYSGVRTA